MTATVTAPPSTVTAPPTAAEPPPPATTPPASAVGVLHAYFGAVNARDYARAWALGGSTFAGTYEQFVRDHATKAHYDLTVLSVDGGVVGAAMDVTQTDGSHRYYTGTYIVTGGAISGTTMHEVGNPATTPPSSGQTPSPPAQGPRYFERCADAWAAGVAPIESGEPGYREPLDADHDGTACEPSPEGPDMTATPSAE
ncbi:excalibur calcium-binding domain-containing protein [Yinghuangia sp. YIM S09857]|uniref:excalibur calcium-binding domain-containing protein n=1 Tax=Yinghuangia sp. YIM S09857 TaxID=3436929 RepID=UPI003F52C28B